MLLALHFCFDIFLIEKSEIRKKFCIQKWRIIPSGKCLRQYDPPAPISIIFKYLLAKRGNFLVQPLPLFFRKVMLEKRMVDDIERSLRETLWQIENIILGENDDVAFLFVREDLSKSLFV